MPIEVQCESCHTRLRAPDTAAGKTKKCPKCGGPIHIPAPEPEPEPDDAGLNFYELALDPEPESPKADAPFDDGVSLPPDAPPPPKKPSRKSPKKTAREDEFGTMASVMASRMDSRERDRGATPLLMIGSFEVTWGRLIGTAVFILALAFAGIWFVTLGPGRTHMLLATETVHALEVLATCETVEPKGLLSGTAPTAAGIKTPMGVLGAAGPTGTLPDGAMMSVGRKDRLLVTSPDPNGDHLLMQVELSSALMNRLGLYSRYELIFRADDFSLAPDDGSAPPVKPRLIFADLEGRADINIGGSGSTDHRAILPAGAAPTTAEYTRRGQQVQTGIVHWAGEAGTRGDLEFEVFLGSQDFSGGGFTADGQVKLTHPAGPVADLDYQGGALTVTWNAGSTGHWTRDTFRKHEGDAPWAKFTVGLLFPRPVGDRPLILTLAGKKIGKLERRYNGKAASAGSSGARDAGVMGYFSLLADARTKARGTVADSNLVQIGIALQMYVSQNGGRLPDRLEDLESAMPGVRNVFENKRTGENPGYVYVKPAETIDAVRNPSQVAILHESRGGRIDPDGSKLFADGHLEARTRP